MGLSACSGGDDDDSMSSVTGGTTSMSATMQKPEQAPASVADLALAAYAAGDAVEKAATDEMKRAGDNLAHAQSAVAVGGSSAVAEAAARMVLDAQRALMDEIERAKAARDAAQERHDADGTTEEDKANLMAAIEDVKEGITTAEESLKTIDGNVMTIRGTDAEDPREPAYWGMQTARVIRDLLTAEEGTPPTTTADTDPTDGNVDEKAVRKHNAEGMTWGQILGGDVMDRRLAGAGGDKVPSTPIAGKKASEFTGTPIGTVEVQSTEDGISASYKGIAGTVRCDNGSGCMVTGGVLGAGWYFVPNLASRTGRFIKDPANTDAYIAEIYAEYGYWLRRGTAGDEDGGDNTVSFFHRTLPTTGTATDFNTLRAGNGSSKAAMEAEYSGEAIGLSFRTVTGSDNTQTSISSGQFTADVNLKAEFGVVQSGAGLSGTVRNFRGDGVNTNWRVTLGRAAINPTGAVTGETVSVGNSTADVGSWNAQAFGRATGGDPGRPEGFRGGFDATFSDGRATGVFATKR